VSNDTHEVDLTKFRRRLEERRAAQAAQKERETFDADLIPEYPYERTEADEALDDAIARIDIIDAYVRYIGKMIPKVRPGQTEGIKISCPSPSHPDKDPSAWINTDKQTWYCGGCDIGGDAQDFAAISKGYSWPDTYKKDGSFRKLRTEMAEDYGFVAVVGPGGAVIIATVEESESPELSSDKTDNDDLGREGNDPDISDKSDTETEKSDISGQAAGHAPDEKAEGTVVSLFEGDAEYYHVPELKWKDVLVPDTFLDIYMRAASLDDVPEEYHFFHALVALGQALGRDVTLAGHHPVFGNLFVCLLGKSGAGKSRAKRHFTDLVRKALPYKEDDPDSRGTKVIEAPGSGESLIKAFQKPVYDPANPKIIAYNAPVRGVVHYSELSGLLTRGNRMGSSIKPTMQQFYDCDSIISTTSLTYGTKEAQSAYASAITSTQPSALRDLVSKYDDASGFLNRWVFVLGTEKERDVLEDGIKVDISPAVSSLSEVFAWANTLKWAGEQVTWTEEAGNRFVDFYQTILKRDQEESHSALLARMDLLMKKLILLFSANLKEKEIPLSAVESAINLYDFLLAGYSITGKQLGQTLYSEVEASVLACVSKRADGLSMSQIMKSLWRRNYPTELLLKVVNNLVVVGLLEMVSSNPSKPGRKTKKYRYVS
jgi:hypothetical protein